MILKNQDDVGVNSGGGGGRSKKLRKTESNFEYYNSNKVKHSGQVAHCNFHFMALLFFMV